MLKMAGNIGRLFQKLAINHCNRNLVKMGPLRLIVPLGSERSLYTKESLGLDSFEEQRKKTQLQLSNLEDQFKTRMREYASDEKNMIFTEDLKNMVHLAVSDDDLDLVVAMIKRFNQQNQQLRFGNFKFGPVVMRLFHILNKPEIAQKSFKNEESSGFYDQLVTYQIYLDLLYENKMYKEVLENFDLIQNRQNEGAMFPRNSIVLVLAACYKLNNPESLEYAFKLWKKLEQTGYYPTRRAVTYCAALALNQGNADAALEIVSNAKNQGYTTVRNIKVLALTQLGRLEDVIPILKGVLQQEIAGNEVHTFNRDVMDKIREQILKQDNPEVTVEFNRIEQLFQKQGHISEKSLDEQLCTEIQKPTLDPRQDRTRDWSRRPRQNYDNRGPKQFQNNRTNFRQRPGLEDLN